MCALCQNPPFIWKKEKKFAFFVKMEYYCKDIEKGDEAMICSVRTMGINGIKGSGVVAECYISNGLPAFDIVGLPDAAVKEARERVRAAAKNSGLTFPSSRITVNLAPANLKKAGSHFDLPTVRFGAFPVCCPWRWRQNERALKPCLFRRRMRLRQR